MKKDRFIYDNGLLRNRGKADLEQLLKNIDVEPNRMLIDGFNRITKGISFQKKDELRESLLGTISKYRSNGTADRRSSMQRIANSIGVGILGWKEVYRLERLLECLGDEQVVETIRLYETVRGGEVVINFLINDALRYGICHITSTTAGKLAHEGVMELIQKAEDDQSVKAIVERIHKTEDVNSLINSLIQRMRKAQSVLDVYGGYLYPSNRQAIKAAAQGLRYISDRTLESCIKRAEGFIAKKIPPIFQEEFESESEDGSIFPVVDEIILLGSGTENFRKKIMKTARWYRKKRVDFQFPRSYPEDVLLFAKHAFDDGQINPHFVRDLEFRMRNHNRTLEKNVAKYKQGKLIVLQVLRKALSQFIPSRTEYPKQFTEGMDLKFLNESFVWCVDYSPQDREKIFYAYVKAISEGALPKKEKTMNRMRALFPHLEGLSIEDIQDRDIRRRYAEAIESGKYSRVPSVIFVDPQYEELKREVIVKIFEMLRQHRDDPAIVEMKIGTQLARHLGLDPVFIHLPGIVGAINGYRLEQLKGMSDEKFLELFPHQLAANGYGMLRYGYRRGGACC